MVKYRVLSSKWNPNVKAKIPDNFSKTYNAKVKIITRDNFREFVNL